VEIASHRLEQRTLAVTFGEGLTDDGGLGTSLLFFFEK
jgi:hypothetical protein